MSNTVKDGANPDISVQPSLLFSIHYPIPYSKSPLSLDIFKINWILVMKIGRGNSIRAYPQVFVSLGGSVLQYSEFKHPSALYS